VKPAIYLKHEKGSFDGRISSNCSRELGLAIDVMYGSGAGTIRFDEDEIIF